jgi:hypothetical protein
MPAHRLFVGCALLAVVPVACKRSESAPGPEPATAPATVVPSELKPPPVNPALAAAAKPLGDCQVCVGYEIVSVLMFDGVEYHPWELEPVARDLYANGRYAEALEAYTAWTNRGAFCGNELYMLRGLRYHRIALCNAYLKDHAAAADMCFHALGRSDWSGTVGTFLVQLYREANQLDDLGPLLDAIEKAVIDQYKPVPYLTPEENRQALRWSLRTRSARFILEDARDGNLAPWPDGVPKPKIGSLPKTLPK